MPATFKIPFLILVCKSAPWLQRTGGDVVELPGTDRTRITHGRYWLQPQLYTSEVQIPVLYHCTAHMVKSKTFYQYSTQACLGCKSKSWTLKIYFIIGCRTPHLFLLQSSRMQKHDSAVQSSVLYCSFFNHIKYNCTNHSRHPRKQTNKKQQWKSRSLINGVTFGKSLNDTNHHRLTRNKEHPYIVTLSTYKGPDHLSVSQPTAFLGVHRLLHRISNIPPVAA